MLANIISAIVSGVALVVSLKRLCIGDRYEPGGKVARAELASSWVGGLI